MNDNFCLSDEIAEVNIIDNKWVEMIYKEQVKEFIRRLKEKVVYNSIDLKMVLDWIDKLAGPELVEQ